MNTVDEIIIKVTPKDTPNTYQCKIAELVEQGVYKTKEDAEKDNPVFELKGALCFFPQKRKKHKWYLMFID